MEYPVWFQEIKARLEPESLDPALLYALYLGTKDLIGNPSAAEATESGVRHEWTDAQGKAAMQAAYEARETGG